MARQISFTELTHTPNKFRPGEPKYLGEICRVQRTF